MHVEALSRNRGKHNAFLLHFGVVLDLDDLSILELFNPRSMIFEDAQVEAWHETPDLSIDQGGAFFSGGPFNLTRSNLTAP